MKTAPDWHHLPDPHTLAPGMVHLWRVSVSAALPWLGRSHAVLSDTERQRAQRFVQERDRQQFILGRGLLRQMLGIYLQAEPQALQLTYGAHGKPTLPQSPIHFNLSHSGDWLLYGLATVAIGVDIEAVRPVAQMAPIVERYFSQTEQAVFAALPPDQQTDAFFRAWVCKEAFLKATGDGLTLPLTEVAVELRPQHPARFCHLPPLQDLAQWQLWAFEVAPQHPAAVAIAQPHSHLYAGDWLAHPCAADAGG